MTLETILAFFVPVVLGGIGAFAATLVGARYEAQLQGVAPARAAREPAASLHNRSGTSA